MNNFNNWDDFFKTIDFTFYRTSQIQTKYIDMIAKYSKNFSFPKLLEIAGGSGYTSIVLSDLLKKTNPKVIYSDLSEKLVLEVKEKFNTDKIEFSVQDSNNLSFNNKSIDIIFHQGFLEHFDDNQIIKFLKEQARVAEYIIFDVPNSRRWNKNQEFGNERFLSHKEWQNLVKKAGLNIYEVTARRFSNTWKKFMPVALVESNLFHNLFGESTIIVCGAK